jgi:hypothetical protein
MTSLRRHRSSWRLKDPACRKAAHKRPRFVARGRTVSDSARDIISLLVLHGEAALDDALGGQLRRILIISTSVTETRMETAVKTPSRKTNNQASFGGSLLKNNMEVEAAMELLRHLDEAGVHRISTIYV